MSERGRGNGRGGRGGRGRGRGRGGGSMTRDRSSDGRDAVSIEKLFQKNTRYDHRVAKQKKFWEKSKQLRKYHRLLRHEGYEKSAADSSPSIAVSASSIQPPVPSIPQPSNPDDIFHSAGPQLLPKDDGRQWGVKQKKKKRDENDDGEDGNDDDSASSKKKKRRLTEEEVAQLRAEKEAARANRERELEQAAERRREKFSALTQRTKKGQPVMANQMEYLLQKLKKQQEQNETIK